MNFLSLETSTDACSVALLCNDELLVDHRIAPQKHAQLLLPMIDTLLAGAGLTPRSLDGIAFGCGPGSFTGVRIAAATAQGIALGADVGVVPVSSLKALAQGANRLHTSENVLACFDARMGEVYWAAYQCDDETQMQLAIAETVCAPEDVGLPESIDSWLLIGSGADQYEKVVQRCNESLTVQHVRDGSPSAEDVMGAASAQLKAGELLSAENAVPVYLRNKVALTEAERAQGQRL